MTPDSYIRWYFRQRESGHVRGHDLVRSTGFVYYKRCGAPYRRFLSKRQRALGKQAETICSSKRRQWSSAQRRYVCGKCGAPWRYRERRALHGEVQETIARADGSEKKIQRFVDVGVAIRRLEERTSFGREGALYVAWARGESIRRLAERAARGDFGPERAATSGHGSIQRAVALGGREWRAVLREARLRFDDSAVVED